MKYIITIDTAKNKIVTGIVRPYILRIGDETDEELARRREVLQEWRIAKIPNWLQSAVDIVRENMEIDDSLK